MLKILKIFIPLLFFIVPMITYSQTQTEMNLHAHKTYDEADKKMAIIYKNIMTKVDAPAKKLLLIAQRNWIKYKEAHCTSAANEFDGGSMQPLIYYSCLAEITEQRIAQLKYFLEEK